ncbi:hypothetical protein AB4Z40_28785 [Bosea sp. 2YAB26]|uniref:hypothetical protein n=1 Tax=unclassified Bosea (in: a-proteobacteria) TaxID=2653178 RepID=UPI003F92BD74
MASADTLANQARRMPEWWCSRPVDMPEFALTAGAWRAVDAQKFMLRPPKAPSNAIRPLVPSSPSKGPKNEWRIAIVDEKYPREYGS